MKKRRTVVVVVWWCSIVNKLQGSACIAVTWNLWAYRRGNISLQSKLETFIFAGLPPISTPSAHSHLKVRSRATVPNTSTVVSVSRVTPSLRLLRRCHTAQHSPEYRVRVPDTEHNICSYFIGTGAWPVNTIYASFSIAVAWATACLAAALIR